MLPALSQLPERIDGTSIRFERSEQNDPCPSPKKKQKKKKGARGHVYLTVLAVPNWVHLS
jgi:hypothetical protein